MEELAGLALLLLALCAVASLKFPTSVLAPLLFISVPLPLVFSIIGIFPDAEGLYASLQVIELSDSTPTTADLAGGGRVVLLQIFTGLVLSLPAYALALVVLSFRAFAYPAAQRNVELKAVSIERTTNR